MSSRLRVWVVPGIYPYPEETGERWKGIFLHRQAFGLKQLGVDVRVVQPRDWFPPWPLWTVDSAWRTARAEWRPAQRVIDTVPVCHPVVFSPRPSRLFQVPHRERVIARLVRFLRAQGTRADRDVLLCHWLIPDGFIGTRVAKAVNLPVAVEILGDDVALWPFQSDEHMRQAQWVLEHATSLLACSDDLGRKATALCPSIPLPRTVYMPVACDSFVPPTAVVKEQERRKLGLSAGDVAILGVGTLLRRKGWVELLDAFAALAPQFPSLRLVAVHGGVPDFDLAEETARRRFAERVLDLGEISPDALAPIYQAADLFVLPSHREGLSNAVLEAMASGLPVITTPVGGHPEVIEPGVSGEFVPVGNAAELERTMRRLLEHREMWGAYGERARTSIVRHASPDVTARRLLDVLESTRRIHDSQEGCTGRPAIAGTC